MDLQYPIGKFRRPPEFNDEIRQQGITTIAQLPAELSLAVEGLSAAQLATPYRPEGWTVRQVVHHVADSHLNMYARLRLALTEDEPTVKPYAEAAWAALPDGRDLPVEVSLAMLTAMHHRTDVLLRSLEPAQFARAFRHPESGLQSIDSLVALYAWHGRHHTAHITELRTREGWT